MATTKGKTTRTRVKVPRPPVKKKVTFWGKLYTSILWIYKHLLSYKTPLVLANVSQSSLVGVFIYQKAPTHVAWFNMIVAIISATAFDLAIVATAFMKKHDRIDWIVSIITSGIALLFGSAIAYTITNDILHVGWALVVCSFSWLLALNQRQH